MSRYAAALFRSVASVGFALALSIVPSLGISSTSPMGDLPVQDGGRVKPYDTFAREALQLISGKQEYEGRPAVEVVTTWFLAPQLWENRKFFEITHRGLKESLNLDVDQKFFAYEDFFKEESSRRLGLVFQELASKREAREKLDPFYQSVSRLSNQLNLFLGIRTGKVLFLVPMKKDASGANAQAGADAAQTPEQPPDRWLSLSEMPENFQNEFAKVTQAFVRALPQKSGEAAKSDVDRESAHESLRTAVDGFIALARMENPQAYGEAEKIHVENLYNDIHPFQWAWILYLFATIILGVAWHTDRKSIYNVGWLVALLAFAVHTSAFGFRVYLMGRPPVTNMFESVVWVSWGATLFAMILERVHKTKFILMAGTSVAILCLIVANAAPAILDRSLQPLEPVLRSNLWLTVHVLTISISYSAFFLAFGLADIGLFYVLRGQSSNSPNVRSIALACYRSIQIGVVLLAAGTILGGVWADYSWGRFWGWDPKETWALIALLGYLAVLHGRLVGWVQNFGMLACSVVSFSLVIMAWYGVNYVLGAGLHSYGFGAGGVQYVAAFVLAHLIYVGYVSYVYFATKARSRTA